MTRAAVSTIDEYIKTFSSEIQIILQKLRKLVKEVEPSAKELISYKMPTFEIANGNRVYFAANKKHVGFYAIYEPTDMEDELKPYRSTKDTLRFLFDEPMPYDLIKKVIKYKFKH
jgi:uncharacterized protein YdhG (YjbR/CyaY superfamily)